MGHQVGADAGTCLLRFSGSRGNYLPAVYCLPYFVSFPRVVILDAVVQHTSLSVIMKFDFSGHAHLLYKCPCTEALLLSTTGQRFHFQSPFLKIIVVFCYKVRISNTNLLSARSSLALHHEVTLNPSLGHNLHHGRLGRERYTQILGQGERSLQNILIITDLRLRRDQPLRLHPGPRGLLPSKPLMRSTVPLCR